LRRKPFDGVAIKGVDMHENSGGLLNYGQSKDK
jgi:hypothetical protein